MAARKKASGLGGWRPGSGRKPELRDPVSFTLEIEGQDYAAAQALAKERRISMAALVREALGTYLVRRRKG
jgi:hypothetical protein